MDDAEIYMEIKGDGGSPPTRKGGTLSRKSNKKLKIAAVLMTAVIIIGGMTAYLWSSGSDDDDDEEPVHYDFGINRHWSVQFQNYIITLVDPAKIDELRVIIDDSTGTEEVSGDDMERMNPNQFLLTPGKMHGEGEEVTIKVFVGDVMKGERTLTPLSLGWEDTAAGAEFEEDFFLASVKETFDGREVSVQNIQGTVNYDGSDGGTYVNFTGSGTTHIEQQLENPDVSSYVEMNIDTESFVMNSLHSGEDEFVEYMEQSGTGVGSFDIEAEGVSSISGDLVVTEYGVSAEDNSFTDTTMKAEGEFEGTYDGEIEMETVTTGREDHDNYMGVKYPCLVLENKMHIKASEGPIPIIITSREKLWSVKSMDFDYNTIYYEANTTITGQPASEDSGYIEDAPRSRNITINDVIRVRGLIPADPAINDSFTMESRYGFEISYNVVSASEPSASDKVDGTVTIEGSVTREGEGWDILILAPAENGMMEKIERQFAFRWQTEYLSANLTRESD